MKESDLIKYWKDNNTFQKSNENKDKNFVFYDGPPFATGKPHYGHLLVGTIKDVVARYKSMTGHSVPRKWGWDCHGVPVESLVQSKMECSSSDIIRDNRVSEFNSECRSSVLLCADQWRDTVSKLGRWVDFDNSYKTMDINYMESVWWAFKQIYSQDRVYKAKKIMPYSCKLQTTLSNSEISDSYKSVKDPFVIVKFKTVNQNFSILVYTTTPWTLPTNAGICLNPDIEYSVINVGKDSQENFLIASNLIDKVVGSKPYTIVSSNKGSDFTGLEYYSLNGSKKLPVVNDSYVLDSSGTGAVHISPLFGEDDYRVGKENNLEMLDLLDQEGKFISGKFSGIFCKDADELIINDLKESDHIFKYGVVTHDYPFCPRTNTPLIYRAVDAWYLKVEDIKDRLLANNATINWYPAAIGANRFANWISSSNDWNISRNRLWGSCIPIWIADDGTQICIGSIKELEDLSGVEINDLHKDILDQITFIKDGKLFSRVPEVLDCWFESGCMPYAQHHYPFENKQLVEDNFPADFIVEGLDQTRGWFYTLLVISTIIFDKAPFKNVMVNGLVLSSDGTKMSKSKGNYTPVEDVLDKYGADALRTYLCSSSVLYGEPLQFSETNLAAVSGKIINPLKNALDFYKIYKKIDNWSSDNNYLTELRELDHWMLNKLNVLINDSIPNMESYELSKVLPRVSSFLDDLCNWYIRSSRSLFWQSGVSPIKNGAFRTLHYTLLNVSKILAPFAPFVSEYVYKELGYNNSIHLESYPTYSPIVENGSMDVVRDVVSIAHNLRIKSGIKVRQPLSELMVYGADFSSEELDLIKNEVNVKTISVFDSEYIEEESISYKANFKTLGRKCGIKVNNIAKAILLLNNPVFPVQLEEFNILEEDVIKVKNIISKFPSESRGKLSVVLNTKLTDQLIEEGDVRDICSHLQNVRKDLELHPTDRINIYYSGNDKIEALINKYSDLIKKRLLADSISKIDSGSSKLKISLGEIEFNI